jgi:cell division protein FtsL
MKRAFWCFIASASCRFSVFVSVLYFSLIPAQAFSAQSHENYKAVSSNTSSFLSVNAPDFILTLAVSLIVIFILIMYFLSKLRKANRELRERNKQIEDINLELQKANRDLSKQKEAITREYSY